MLWKEYRRSRQTLKRDTLVVKSGVDTEKTDLFSRRSAYLGAICIQKSVVQFGSIWSLSEGRQPGPREALLQGRERQGRERKSRLERVRRLVSHHLRVEREFRGRPRRSAEEVVQLFQAPPGREQWNSCALRTRMK